MTAAHDAFVTPDSAVVAELDQAITVLSRKVYEVAQHLDDVVTERRQVSGQATPAPSPNWAASCSTWPRPSGPSSSRR